MIWTHIRSGRSTSETFPQMAALSGLSFYVDEMKIKCPESMPPRSGSRVGRVTHNSNDIHLDEKNSTTTTTQHKERKLGTRMATFAGHIMLAGKTMREHFG